MAVPSLSPTSPAGNAPTVSIVMPTHKRAAIIGETLKSVVTQSFREFELIIRADGTDDGTGEVIARVNDPRIKYTVAPERRGMPGVLNDAIAESRGRYILTLHDHDLFRPELVERMMSALEEHSSALYVHTALEIIDQAGAVTETYRGNYAPLTTGDNWLRFMMSKLDCPVCAMSMVRRSAYEQYGLYETDYGFVADVEMWMRLASHGDVVYLRDVLMSVRAREAGHEYIATNWKAVDSVIRMHQRYIADSGTSRTRFNLMAEKYRLTSFLASMKQSRLAQNARRDAKTYLSQNGGLLSRVAASLIPG